jgi:uncharacterized protein YbjT (DUF2867 family)
MTFLVTGSTGTVGSEVTRLLAETGADVRALTRSPGKAHFPEGVTAVEGEMTDTDAMRAALDGVDGLFLLNAVSATELTEALITLGLAQAAGVGNIVYLSVINVEKFTDTPHIAAKAAAERMIAEFDLPATILRPGYYMQNDSAEKDRILGDGVYGPPLGSNAVLMTDTRDLAEVAVRSLIRRQGANRPQPRETIDVVAPQVLTGATIATMWAEAVGRPVVYGGDDLDAFEERIRPYMPSYQAYDVRMMMGGFQRDGISAAPGTDDHLRALLGRPMRSYQDFVREMMSSWNR